MKTEAYSILTPQGGEVSYKNLSPVTIHDLGIDAFVKTVSQKPDEQKLLQSVLSAMTDEPHVTAYRSGVFKDVYDHPEMCEALMKILDRIDFLKSYHFRHDYEEKASIWSMMHRLEDIRDYITCVEGIHTCLSDVDLKSEGLTGLREYVRTIYEDHGFQELKQDIDGLNATTDNLKSVTVGVNLNTRFEAESIGIISVNSKPFTHAPIVGSFVDKVSHKDQIEEEAGWNGSYKYHPFNMGNAKFLDFMNKGGKMAAIASGPLYALNTLATVPDNDFASEMLRGVDKQLGHVLSLSTRKLREVLDRYVNVTITDMTNLIPEFLYYILFADFVRKEEAEGFTFTMPEALTDGDRDFRARGIFNLKLLGTVETGEIVRNDFTFDENHRVFILTGANRGGKTTITQAVGQYFVLAQGGISVPGESFTFCPVDNILTHFPADEDKTLDLGRLGEECKRFREMYGEATRNSLLLLNETFSTTSFEEGYYIAKDSVKAILRKGIRTIYNTHMHKLGYEIDELNAGETDGKAASLIVETKDGVRSFKVKLALPEGSSYAKDIAEKYGVTYEMLKNMD